MNTSDLIDDKCSQAIVLYRRLKSGFINDDSYVRLMIEIQDSIPDLDDKRKFYHKGREIYGNEFKYACNAFYGLSGCTNQQIKSE